MQENSFRDLSKVDRELLIEGASNLPIALAQMGFPSLRQGQEDPVMSIIAGKDTICILPTGTGKTAVFIVPSLCHGWPTIIMSPLVALMRDQVKGLWDKGIAAGAVSGIQTPAENASTLRAWMDGEIQFLYVAPERLNNEQFQMAVRANPPIHVVVDEAHTISQWSDNFRPAYVRVGEFIEAFNPRVVSAFTATCPAEVEVDIRRVLGIPNAKRCMYYPRRTNLKLSSAMFTGITQIANIVRKSSGCGIVYCSTIKNVEETAAQLSGILDENDQVAIFHGSLPPDVKRTNQDMFMEGRAKVVVATTAFGMGIDKADIRFVIHRDMPGSLEQLAQEVGRAGRDGLESHCYTLMSEQGIRVQQFFLDAQNPDKDTIIQVYNTLKIRADGNGRVMLTTEEIGKLSGVSSHYVGSAISALVGAGSLTRGKADEKICRVKVLEPSTPEKQRMADEDKFKNTMSLIKSGGVAIGQGFIEVDMNWLVDKTERTMATVQKWLKQWDKDELISFVAPFRGSVTFVTGGIEMVDFERLKRKAVEDYKKLQLVQKYFTIPDEDKHAFIEGHFEINRL